MPKLFNFGREKKEEYLVSAENTVDDTALRDLLPDEITQNLEARGILVDRKWERAKKDPISANEKDQDKEKLVNRVGIRKTPNGNQQLMIGLEWNRENGDLNEDATVHFDLYEITEQEARSISKKLKSNST